MPSEQELLSQFLAKPADGPVREVYADWLEERGDERAEFLRAQGAVRAVEPDSPGRLQLEERLSHARKNLDREWLLRVEPERAHLLNPQRANCDCTTARRPSLRLHDEPQDTECDAWRKLVEVIERAALEQPEELRPLQTLSTEERQWIVTLPPAISKLKSLKSLMLYGSALVRIPPEIGELTSLREFTPYTSYRLHWFPYEITRCGYRESTVSTRALYGNHKNRPPFPRIQKPAGKPIRRACSVCKEQFEDTGEQRVWISLRVGTDDLPLLVNACSERCLAQLPSPPKGHVATPHRGGPGLQQPSAE
jgi:uncharacterized protein (TIGR02996 family)